jgi:carbon storage regulator CsrA
VSIVNIYVYDMSPMPDEDDNGYLVLSRRVGEGVLIGDDVLVAIAGLSRGAVRLAIRAPRDRRVTRRENGARAGEVAPPGSASTHGGNEADPRVGGA